MAAIARRAARMALPSAPARSFVGAAAAAAAGEYPSITRGLFQGKLDAAGCVPYPVAQVLSEEQAETLAMLVPPTEKVCEHSQQQS